MAPRHLQGENFPEVKLLYPGDLPEEIAAEVLLVEERRPEVGGELVRLHTGVGSLVKEEGVVALVEFQKGIRHLPENLAYIEAEPGCPERHGKPRV